MSWQLQEAKNKLSSVIKEAQTSGPQVITLHGKEAAVVLSTEEYRKLTRRKGTLVSFLQKSPLAEIDIDLERVKDYGREIDL